MITQKHTIRILAAACLCSAFNTFPGTAKTNIQSEGQAVFEKNCTTCHGSDGRRGRFGAKNLQSSRLNDAALYTIISKGKRIMPSWENRLSGSEIQSVITYIKTLRK